MTKARGDLPDSSADLSEAARAVVRDAGDPRTDAYLAALGLVDAPDPEVEPIQAPAATPTAAEQLALPVAPTVDPELAVGQARIAGLEEELAAAARRVRVLGIALAIAVAGVVVLVALLVSRPA